MRGKERFIEPVAHTEIEQLETSLSKKTVQQTIEQDAARGVIRVRRIVSDSVISQLFVPS